MRPNIFRQINRIVKIMPIKVRNFVYKKLGMQMAKDALIASDCLIDNPARIKLSSKVIVNRYCEFHTGPIDKACVEIGYNSRVGCSVKFLCASHAIGSHEQRRSDLDINESIIVGKGCWIGANSIILPGIRIGDGVVIGAGSLVNKDCEDDWLYAGVPARKVRYLE